MEYRCSSFKASAMSSTIPGSSSTMSICGSLELRACIIEFPRLRQFDSGREIKHSDFVLLSFVAGGKNHFSVDTTIGV